MSQVQLTFFFSTHIPGYHPGVVRLQEKTERSMRDIGEGYSGRHSLFALPGGRVEAPRYLAEALYDDQTYERQGGAHSGRRFDFCSPCRLHLIQRVGPGGEKTGKAPAWRKREMEPLSLPGGQAREEVCRQLASAIESWWEDPGHLAYTPPDQFASRTGAALYDESGERYQWVARFWHNRALVEAPVVFLAWHGDQVFQFATLHRGSSEQGTLFSYYRLFALMHLQHDLLLLDAGACSLEEPIVLPAQKAGTYQVNYCLFDELEEQQKPRVIGGSREWFPSAMYQKFPWLTEILDEARTTYSLYCTECGRGFLWEVGDTFLEDLARAGVVPVVCPHSFFCAECEHWSTPTTRSAHYTVEQERCPHDRPTSEVRRIPSLAISPLPRSWDGRRAVGPYGSELTEDAAGEGPTVRTPQTGGGEGAADVIVVLRFDSHDTRPEPDHSPAVPKGTTLIGTWAEDQPRARGSFSLVVGGITWTFAYADVTATCPIGRKAPEGEQERIAHESLQRAQVCEARGALAEGARWYARALIEYEGSGASALFLAGERLNYAELLVRLERLEEARTEFDEAARVYEAEALDTDQAAAVQGEYADLAIGALLKLASVCLRGAAGHERLRTVADRLLLLRQLVKNRVATSVALLLQVSELLYAVRESEAAATHFAQALVLYDKQFGQRPSAPRVAPLTESLQRVESLLYQVSGDAPLPLELADLEVQAAAPHLLFDMAVIIGAAYQREQLEVTKAGQLHKRVRAKLRARLQGLERPGGEDGADDLYPDMLFQTALQLGLLVRADQGPDEGDREYRPGRMLASWSGLALAEECSTFLDWWSKVGTSWWDPGERSPRGVYFPIQPSTQARALLLSSLNTCQPGRWYALRSLLYLLWRQHPHTFQPGGAAGSWAYASTTRLEFAQWERLEGERFVGILRSTLYELGLISLAFPRAGQAGTQAAPQAFSLTELGACVLLGQRGEAAAGEQEPLAGVIVQPNYEVLLVKISMPTLYDLLPFCRVKRLGMASTLELARDSVLCGRAAGLSHEAMLTRLAQQSRNELPQNVGYTLKEWAQAYQDPPLAFVEQAYVIRTEDETTAERLCRTAFLQRRGVQRLGPCLLAIPLEKSSLAEVRSALKREGVTIR